MAGTGTSRYRRWLLQRVACPTLITGSRHDGGVAFAHAEDFAATIPGARLVELNSFIHLFWIGPHAETARQAVQTFVTRQHLNGRLTGSRGEAWVWSAGRRAGSAGGARLDGSESGH